MASLKENAKLLEAVQKFMVLLWKYDCVYFAKDWRRSYKDYRPGREGKQCRNSLKFYKDTFYHSFVSKKYIYIDAWGATNMVVDSSGRMYKRGTRRHRCGQFICSIYDCLDEKKWGTVIRREVMQIDRAPYEVFVYGKIPTCKGCGRNKNLRPTVNGDLCQYCRGSDARHMNTVRQLGGTPHVHGLPLKSNRDYCAN